MTDNEIIKALECCINDHCTTSCPMYKTTDVRLECKYLIAKYALDLINRLNAENERLTTAYPKTLESIKKIYATAKSEAYKKFAERLLQRKYQSSDWSHGEHPFVVEENDILEVLEEMG